MPLNATYCTRALSGRHQRYSKCVVTWPHQHPPPPVLQAACAERGVKLAHGIADVLGTVVGFDGSAMRAWVDEQVDQHAQLFRDLQHREMPCQVSTLLLRVAAVPRMDYVLRTLPPDITAAGAARFDDMVRDTFCQRNDITTTDAAQVSINLPIRHGGIGLRSMQRVAPAAFVSSLSLSASDVRPLLEKNRLDATPSVHPTARGLVSAFGSLLAEGVTTDKVNICQDKPTAAEFWTQQQSEPTAHLQKLLSHAIDDAHAARQFASASESDRARLNSTSAPGAGLWLCAVPTTSELFLPDHAFRIALRLRLGLPTQSDLPRRCTCGASLLPTATSANTAHFLTCHHQTSTSGRTRHDWVVKRLVSHARRAGLPTYYEPYYVDTRPDGEIYYPDQQEWFDVSVIHPAAASYVRQASQQQLYAAGVREKAKVAKHGSNARSQHASIVPVVFESYGAFGECAKGFISRIVAYISEATLSGASAAEERQLISQEIAIAIQSGNALMIRKGAMHARYVSARGCIPGSRPQAARDFAVGTGDEGDAAPRDDARDASWHVGA